MKYAIEEQSLPVFWCGWCGAPLTRETEDAHDCKPKPEDN